MGIIVCSLRFLNSLLHFLHPHVVATKKLFRTTQTSMFPAQNPLPGEKWQFYSDKLGVKLQKQERSNLLFLQKPTTPSQ